ncbi:hypothetical protein [Escherichia marmotae]|uniref:hypothetical protein n=1 Tax=Escherichia marmotae TaxID=1499973 RepID=UPI0012B5E154|nr:hypothetical protein [Escherichia marmotae]
MADTDLVCRGGTCLADQFTHGSGVSTNADGTLNGVSTQAKPGAPIEVLAQPYKNGTVGVTTVADIEKAGGKIILDGVFNSTNGTNGSNHATVSGITAEQAEVLFKTEENPVPKSGRGFEKSVNTNC